MFLCFLNVIIDIFWKLVNVRYVKWKIETILMDNDEYILAFLTPLSNVTLIENAKRKKETENAKTVRDKEDP